MTESLTSRSPRRRSSSTMHPFSRKTITSRRPSRFAFIFHACRNFNQACFLEGSFFLSDLILISSISFLLSQDFTKRLMGVYPSFKILYLSKQNRHESTATTQEDEGGNCNSRKKTKYQK
jgi:hypothetical protein